MNTFWRKLKNLFTVPDTFEPDDLRRRRVLNTTLIVMMALPIAFLVIVYADEDISLFIADLRKDGLLSATFFSDWLNPLATCLGAIVLSAVLLRLNRSKRIPKNLVGWIFVIGMIATISTSDFPIELTNGRGIFEWAVPVILSVVILPPASVFAVDAIITVLFWFFGGMQWEYFQTYTLFTIYAVSFLSWIGMSIAERAIRDARNESKKNVAILDGVAEGVIVLGPNNQIVLANRAASDLIGSEMAGINPMAENAEIHGRALSFHWSEVEGLGRVAIVRDISRQVEIDHAKDAMLGVVSHEMRTPLAAILGYCELLKVHPTPETADRIRANALRMVRIVDNLLDLAQLQAGALKLYSGKFSPRLLAIEANKLFCAHAMEKQVVLKLVVSDALPDELIGDFRRYQQILANLVDNAIRFSKEGGCVDVLLEPGEEADTWQMVVSDTGIGIPPERLPDIFLPFRRASDYTRRSSQGTGLGLSIAKWIAQLAHGDIEVKSSVGRGSTFIVTLPINGGAR